MRAAGISENLTIRSLELFADVYAELHGGGSATPHHLRNVHEKFDRDVSNGPSKRLCFGGGQQAHGLEQSGQLGYRSSVVFIGEPESQTLAEFQILLARESVGRRASR